MIVSTNHAAFQEALRDWAATTTRELSKALNQRMFYLLLRAYVLIKPSDVGAARNKARTYLNQVLTARRRTLKSGKTKLKPKARQLQRVMLIAQAIREKSGLKAVLPSNPDFVEIMKMNIAKLRRRGISGQGYAKAGIVKALKMLNRGGFAQWGFSAKYKGKGANKVLVKAEVAPNAALSKIVSEYGQESQSLSSNVGVFKSSKGSVTKAVPGFSPSVTAEFSVKIVGPETGKMEAVFNAAFNQAFLDETDSIRQHLAQRAQEVADSFTA